MAYETLLYDTNAAIATITLNRPERLNTIVPPMPDELEEAVHRAIADSQVKVIVLRGAGRSFSPVRPVQAERRQRLHSVRAAWEPSPLRLLLQR